MATGPGLTINGSAVVGCAAFKKISDSRAELKRLYVRPTERGAGLGQSLSLFIMDRAKAQGYAQCVLDTLERLPWAVRLYEKLGFDRCAAYCRNPMPDVIFFCKDL